MRSFAPTERFVSEVEQGKLKIVGGIYRLTTGTVDLIAQG